MPGVGGGRASCRHERESAGTRGEQESKRAGGLNGVSESVATPVRLGGEA